MLPRPLLLVAAGGAAGAGCRWAIGATLPQPGGWPVPTLTANVVGCLLLGLLAARLPSLGGWAHAVGKEGLSTGFCGGLTTFSTFSVETAQLLRDDRAAVAAGYLAASLVTGYVAYDVARRWRPRPVPAVEG